MANKSDDAESTNKVRKAFKDFIEKVITPHRSIGASPEEFG